MKQCDKIYFPGSSPRILGKGQVARTGTDDLLSTETFHAFQFYPYKGQVSPH